MANPNAPFGLRPVRYASGAPYNGACNSYFATGATGVIAIGDPVTAAGSANTSAFGGVQAGVLPTCTIAADGTDDVLIGVCVGVQLVTRDSTIYRENSTDRLIQVADDPNLIFQVQQDAGGPIAATDVGLFANLKAGTASTITGLSSWVIDGSATPASTVGFQLRLERLAPIPGNAIGDYAIWEVRINNHVLGNITDAGRFTAI